VSDDQQGIDQVVGVADHRLEEFRQHLAVDPTARTGRVLDAYRMPAQQYLPHCISIP